MTEREIIKKIKAGEINLFEVFVKKYSSKMHFYIQQRVRRREDAADILQNSFIKAYKALDRFDEKKPFYPYFFSIVKREIVDFYRKNANLLYIPDIQELPIYYEDVKEDIDISDLKDKYRKVLQLLIEGYSYKEIANKLHKPINTIKTLIRRAKLEMTKKNEK